MDQRVQQTRDALQTSMRELLGSTTWDSITIKKLCESASISRTTFYANFQGKEGCLDSLLLELEKTMQSQNNGRSLATTGTFKFLPLLVNHVNGNRHLFFKTNSSAEGFPVADRFRRMIDRLTFLELLQVVGNDKSSTVWCSFLAGGIYRALVDWSGTSKDATHLTLLAELDTTIQHYMQINNVIPQGLSS